MTLGTFAYWPFYEPPGVDQQMLAIRLKMSGSGYDPSASGVDPNSVAVVPWSPVDDVTPITWTISDIFARCETPGTSETSTVRVQYSTVTGDFTLAGYIDTAGVNLLEDVNESARPASLAVTSCVSGWKFRTTWTVLDPVIAGLSVYVVLYANVA